MYCPKCGSKIIENAKFMYNESLALFEELHNKIKVLELPADHPVLALLKNKRNDALVAMINESSNYLKAILGDVNYQETRKMRETLFSKKLPVKKQ